MAISSWINGSWRKRVKEEVYMLFTLAWPSIMTFFLQCLVPLVSLAFIGHASRHRSKLLLDATALGLSFINVFGYAIIFSLSSATDTLSSQAYGAKNYKMVGIILQRSVLICSLALFPVAALFLNAESILLILYQSPCVARLTGTFCKIVAIALPAVYLEVILVKYLQSQGIVKPTVVTALLSVIASVIGLASLLYVDGLKIEGVAISIASTSFVLLFSIMFYMYMRRPVYKTWQDLSWESLKEWKKYLLAAIPRSFIVCAEWWKYEIGVFITGSVNGVELATYGITLYVIAAGFAVPFGIGTAVETRVKTMLENEEPFKAKRAAIIAVCFAALWSCLEMVLFLNYNHMGKLFTTDKGVIDAVDELGFLGAVYVYSDGLQAVLGGILRGCGRSLPVDVISICCFYLLGLPISLTMVYVANKGTYGFWLGYLAGSSTQFFCVAFLVLRTNFRIESEEAQTKGWVLVQNPRSPVDDQLEQLIDSEELEETSSGSEDHDDNKSDAIRTSPIKLLLIRTPWYIIGLVVLVTGVVLSQYHIHLPYEAECDDTYNDNFTNSTTPHPITNSSINYILPYQL